MQQVAVIHKAHSPAASELARRLEAWLGERGWGCRPRQADSGHGQRERGPMPPLEPDTDLVVVLGGDGTMLGAVRAVVDADLCRTPILGVNLGGLGFLTALSPEECLPAMAQVLAGRFSAPPRLMLRAMVERKGRVLARFDALNDVVVNKAALARIADLQVAVDDRPLTAFRADGLIFSTPTGSTAYNLSAGGPICHPDLDCIVLTPICSFALSNRPLLLGAAMTITLALDPRARDITLTCDGQVGVDLRPGDRVTIARSPKTARLIHSPFREYFAILRTKLRWG